jgi:hypothetical protein
MNGPRLVHVALADDWEGCRRFGEYDVSTQNMDLPDFMDGSQIVLRVRPQHLP